MLEVLLEPGPALGAVSGGTLPHPVLAVTLLVVLLAKELIAPQSTRAALLTDRALNVLILPLGTLFVLNAF